MLVLVLLLLFHSPSSFVPCARSKQINVLVKRLAWRSIHARMCATQHTHTYVRTVELDRWTDSESHRARIAASMQWAFPVSVVEKEERKSSCD